MSVLSQFLRDELELRGWTQSELARRTGLSRQHVSRLLTQRGGGVRRRLPSDETFGRLAAGLGIPEDAIRQSITETSSRPADAHQKPDESALANTATAARTALASHLAEFSSETIVAELKRRIERLEGAHNDDYESAQELVALFTALTDAAVAVFELPEATPDSSRGAYNAVQPLFNRILTFIESVQDNETDRYISLVGQLADPYKKLVHSRAEARSRNTPAAAAASVVSTQSGAAAQSTPKPVVFYEQPHSYPQAGKYFRMPEAAVLTSPQFPGFRFQARGIEPTPSEIAMVDTFLGARYEDRLNVTQIRCTGPTDDDPVYLIRHPLNLDPAEFGPQYTAILASVEYWWKNPQYGPTRQLPTGEYVVIMLRAHDRMGWATNQLRVGDGAAIWPYFTRDGDRPFLDLWRQECAPGAAPYLADGKPLNVTDDTTFAEYVDAFYTQKVATISAGLLDPITPEAPPYVVSEELFTSSRSLIPAGASPGDSNWPTSADSPE
ncbi:helix-turn-helix domain-containing protein [Mycobacteroides abscessus]|uniref:helix-turn-helix domain-containing protein n=1 Tax=Mycobacteroides abscessus TaxID=36809 RepID=UPI0002D56165|nr:helix-turn-helix transcriptional regulator [Mycobacteroides abscessus]